MAQSCKPVHVKQKEKLHNPRCPHYTKHQLTKRSGAVDIHFCLGSRFTFTTQFCTRYSVQWHYTSHQTNLWVMSFLFDKRKTKACQNHPWVNFSLLLTMSVTVTKVYRSVSQGNAVHFHWRGHSTLVQQYPAPNTSTGQREMTWSSSCPAVIQCSSTYLSSVFNNIIIYFLWTITQQFILCSNGTCNKPKTSA